MAIKARRASLGLEAAVAVALSAALSVGFMGGSADAAGLIAKDGKIHACYKWKGKRKGALKVVRGPKVRCPRKWKKVAWYASPRPGPQGATGAPGEKGATGTAGNVVVEELEGKVSELLAKVEALEIAIANLAAIEAAVNSLCTQASTVTDQLNEVEGALGGLSLNTLLAVVLEIPPLPGALPSYSCPT